MCSPLQISILQETVSRLRECVEEAQASSRQGTRDTAAAQHSLRELRLELASTQASHRESMELVRALLTHWYSVRHVLKILTLKQ